MLPEPAALVEAGRIGFLLNHRPLEGFITEILAASTTPMITVINDEPALVATPHWCQNHMSNRHKLILMKLCVEHPEKNVYGSNSQCWLYISAMLERETGPKFEDLQTAVKVCCSPYSGS
ncbi:hypothetical protein EDC01DRAFT_635799 [Geopyxis carbonaria]|nr:hypothetical protein EDC01DRAFT_635799 [Geopyxis carbonaria]